MRPVTLIARLRERTPARPTAARSVTRRRSRWKRWTAALAVVVLVTSFSGGSASANDRTYECTLPPKILVLRGVFEVFSLGMNDLAKKLACRGYDVTLTSWSLALHETVCADERPYVIIGHSLGGRMCRWVPWKLGKCGKRVPLVIIVDANLVKPIPANVDRCLNLYVTNPFGIFHGSPVRGESPCTEIINWDVSQGQPSCVQGGVNHFDIDATAWVHDIIIDELEEGFPSPLSLAMSGKPGRGEVAPPDAPSEIRLPVPREIQTLARSRSIRWSPSREVSWSPERTQGAPLISWGPERPNSSSWRETR